MADGMKLQIVTPYGDSIMMERLRGGADDHGGQYLHIIQTTLQF